MTYQSGKNTQCNRAISTENNRYCIIAYRTFYLFSDALDYFDNRLKILSFGVQLVGLKSKFGQVAKVSHLQACRMEIFNEACPTK